MVIDLKNETFKFLFLYILTVLTFLVVIYVFLNIFGFNKIGFFYAAIAILVLALFFGFLLSYFSFSKVVETNKLLDRLLKDTLHELNIPVATIIANVDLIKRKESDEKKLKRLDRIKKASNQLLSLYKDLDYYIKREIQKVDYEVFNLKDLVEDRVLFFNDIKKDIKIESDLKDVFVKADKSGFSKVIDNLLSNAIKYNKKDGFIKISLNENELIVEDSGIGMDESEIVRVFERYYQASDFNRGFGIGLNIVKSFCDENSISISIRSKKGVGTKISLGIAKILT